MGAVLKFPVNPSRGPATVRHDREPLATNPRRSRAGAVSLKPIDSKTDIFGQKTNPACKIIVRGLKLRVSPSGPLLGQLAGEAGAYCCRFTGSFIGQGASTDLLNFSRRFKAPGSLLLSALQAGKQTARCLFQSLFPFAVSVLGHVGKYTEETGKCLTPVVSNPTPSVAR